MLIHKVYALGRFESRIDAFALDNLTTAYYDQATVLHMPDDLDCNFVSDDGTESLLLSCGSIIVRISKNVKCPTIFYFFNKILLSEWLNFALFFIPICGQIFRSFSQSTGHFYGGEQGTEGSAPFQ